MLCNGKEYLFSHSFYLPYPPPCPTMLELVLAGQFLKSHFIFRGSEKSHHFHLESSSLDAGGTLSGLGGRVGAGGQNLEGAVAEVRNVRCDEREVKP